MATEKQMDANRRNAERSTGPKTDEGKAKSSRNATTHGMTSRFVLPDDLEAATQKRFDEWSPSFLPKGAYQENQLLQAVSASLRIEHCQQHETQRRIELARVALSTGPEWDDARKTEAACLGKTLKRDPELTAIRLRQTPAGRDWLIAAWTHLLVALPKNGESSWSNAESNRVLDLLGKPKTLRPQMIEQQFNRFKDPVATRNLILGAIAKLEADQANADAENDSLREVDALGFNLVDDAKLKLIRRYEMAAQRQFDKLVKSLRKPIRATTASPNEPNSQPTAPEPNPETKPNSPTPKQQTASTPTEVRVDPPAPGVPAPKGNRLNRRKLQSQERHDAYLARIRS